VIPSVFVDTDIILDFFLGREPFSQAAARLFSLSRRGEIQVSVTVLSFANTFYLLRKQVGIEKSKELLCSFRQWVTVLTVDAATLDHALASPFSDFEDALQYHAALPAGMTAVITRNIRDYRNAAIPVMTADEYLAQLASR